MNVEWSNKYKEIVQLLKKEDSFNKGIKELILFREMLSENLYILLNLKQDKLSACPFMNNTGYESKTIMYSIYHIMRIEDLCFNILIKKNQDIFNEGNFQVRLNSPIKTTGNELKGEELVLFSSKIDKKQLKEYVKEVITNTNNGLKELKYSDLKKSFNETDRMLLLNSKGVSDDSNASWLIDYWLSKDIYGLIKMPFTRHWIMHIEAAFRIKNELVKKAKKIFDQVSYCGHSCQECYLGKYCGGCRSDINICSFAGVCKDGICPNVLCAQKKNIEGCYCCSELSTCKNGYNFENNIEALGSAFFIQKYGKACFVKTLNKAIKKGFNYPNEMQKSQNMIDSCQKLEKYLK